MNLPFNISLLQKKMLANVSWAIFGKVFNMLGTLVIGIFIARYLGAREYGVLKYVISIVSLFTVLATFGTDNIILRELSKPLQDKSAILGSAFIFRVLMSVITFLLLMFFVRFYEKDSTIIKYILLYATSLFSVPLAVSALYFKSVLKNEFIVKSEIIRTLFSVSLKVLFIVYDIPLFWFVFISAIDIIFPFVFCLFFMRNMQNPLKWTVNVKLIKFLGRASLPLLLAGVSATISSQVDQVMLRKFIGTESVGFYGVAISFLSLIIFLPQIVGTTVFPILVGIKEKSEKQFEEKIQLFSDFVFWGSFVLALIVSLLAQWFVPLLYGPEYAPSIPILQILAWKCVIVSFGITTTYWAIAYGFQKSIMIRDIIGALVNIGLNFLLIPKFGTVGAAWTTIISYSISVYFSHYFIRNMRPAYTLQNKTILLGIPRIVKFLQNILIK